MLKTLFLGLFPIQCVVCQAEESWLCCDLPPAPSSRVKFKYLDGLHSVTDYASSKKIVETLKFKGLKALGPVMAEHLYKIVPETHWDQFIVVPIPLHWQRKHWRGFNQAELIIPAEANKKSLLERVKKTQQQARLNKLDRVSNLKNAFICTDNVINKNIILIDDVVTSGQTLDEAAKILKQAGARKVIGVTFAA